MPRLHGCVGLTLALGCTAMPAPAPSVTSTPDVRVAAPAADGAAGSGVERALNVPGFLPAILYSPSGSERRRLLVAAHGAGGMPEWDCDYWRRMTHDELFVLCLRGKSMGSGGGFYYPNHLQLEAELVAAQAAARSAEPRILPGEGMYAGFSQGSSMGSIMLPRHAGAFPYLALVEGFELWNVPRARAFAKAGGKRVLFACGTRHCNSTAEDSKRWLVASGVDARNEYVEGGGHTAGGAVAERVAAALPWLLGPN